MFVCADERKIGMPTGVVVTADRLHCVYLYTDQCNQTELGRNHLHYISPSIFAAAVAVAGVAAVAAVAAAVPWISKCLTLRIVDQ